MKIEIEVKRGETVSGLMCDGYVLVTWTQELDGSKVFPPLLNASSPPEEVGPDLAYAVGVLAIAMQRSSNEDVKISGKLVRATLEKGLMMLEAASKDEIPEG